MKVIEFKIIKDDNLNDGESFGFGGFVKGSLLKGDPTIILNIRAIFGDLFDEGGNLLPIESSERKNLLLETLTHEFCHSMQELLNMEFSENQVEEIIEHYRELLPTNSDSVIHTLQ